MLDSEYRAQLIEQRKMKRRILHELEMKKALYGVSAEPNIIIQAENLVREIRSIEIELGESPTPTTAERRATPVPPRQVEPEPVFQERMTQKQMSARHADIEHQMTLLNIHRGNLGHLRAQMRELGAFAPPYVRNGVDEQRAAIVRIKGILRTTYGQTVEDLEGDE